MHVEQNFISASGAAARRFVDAVLNGVRRGKYVAAGRDPRQNARRRSRGGDIAT